jgi:putative transposase
MDFVKRLQAYRFELMPNGEQKRKLRQFAGSARYVFNRALAIQNQERESTGRKRSGYAALCRMLTAWRNDPQTAWLAEAPVHTTQQALRNLEAAWSRHFESLGKRTRGQIKPEEVVKPPQFKKKHRCRDSFRYPDPKQFQIEPSNSRLSVPKLGWLRYRNSRRIQGEPASVTVCREGENGSSPSRPSARWKNRSIRSPPWSASTWAWRASRRFPTAPWSSPARRSSKSRRA